MVVSHKTAEPSFLGVVLLRLVDELGCHEFGFASGWKARPK